MIRVAWTPLLLIGCTKDEVAETPILEISSPAQGATVAAGDVDFSVVVEHFELVTPEVARVVPFDPTAWLPIASAYAHGDGASQGWLSVSLDGSEVMTLGETQGTLSAVAAGAHELSIELTHEDGDPMDPAVEASVSFTAE